MYVPTGMGMVVHSYVVESVAKVYHFIHLIYSTDNMQDDGGD